MGQKTSDKFGGIVAQLEPAAAEQVRAGNMTIYAGMAASQSISLRRIADLCNLAAGQEGLGTGDFTPEPSTETGIAA